MDQTQVILFAARLEKQKQISKEFKQSSDDSEDARHWAVVYTDLEKVSAYVQTYLLKESEE